jgi:hypothetical protein
MYAFIQKKAKRRDIPKGNVHAAIQTCMLLGIGLTTPLSITWIVDGRLDCPWPLIVPRPNTQAQVIQTKGP